VLGDVIVAFLLRFGQVCHDAFDIVGVDAELAKLVKFSLRVIEIAFGLGQIGGKILVLAFEVGNAAIGGGQIALGLGELGLGFGQFGLGLFQLGLRVRVHFGLGVPLLLEVIAFVQGLEKSVADVIAADGCGG